MSSYADFADKLLIALYQETEASGRSYQRVGPLLKKYGISYKPLWISQVADEWEHHYLRDVSRILGGYDGWSFRISAQGIREIEERYGDKDGVGQILAPVTDDISDLTPDEVLARIVPASDRIVNVDDNSAGFEQAVQQVEEARSVVEQSNLLPSTEKNAILVHLDAGLAVLRKAGNFAVGAVRYLILDRLKTAFEGAIEDAFKTILVAAFLAVAAYLIALI